MRDGHITHHASRITHQFETQRWEDNDPVKKRLYGALIAALLVGLIVACSGLPGQVAQLTATPTKTPRPTWTATPPATDTPLPTNTPQPTDTPAPTDTPLPPTAVPTDTVAPPTGVPTAVLLPTQSPIPATAAPTRPAATRTPAPPTKTPAPPVDFRVVEQKLVPKALNEAGLHSLFIRVIDAAGNPLHGVSVWDPTHPDQVAVTGDKPDPYSAEYQLWSTDNYFLEVRDSKSEKTKGLSTDRPKISNADLIAAGYCTDDSDCNLNVHTMHFSWYITFQRTR